MTINSIHLLKKLSKNWSIEVTPSTASKIEDFSSILKKRTKVNVTFLPGSDFNSLFNVCKKLHNEGMLPVPHISARGIKNIDELDSILKSLNKESKVKEILVIAGSLSKPKGDFSETMQILDSGLLQKYGVTKVGVAGHPEGSPDIKPALVRQALELKNEWSKKEGIPVYLETQFAFDAKPVLDWEKEIRLLGNKLNIHVGIPGPATIKTLFQFAKASGVGPSMRMLTKQARNITKLLTVQSPDKYILGLAKGVYSDSECLIKKLHYYPFGGFKKTADWAKKLENGYISLNENDGFQIIE